MIEMSVSQPEIDWSVVTDPCIKNATILGFTVEAEGRAL